MWLCLILFFACADPWGADEGYPKWIVACSLCSFQIWGSIPQTPSVTKTGNMYAFLFPSFFFSASSGCHSYIMLPVVIAAQWRC